MDGGASANFAGRGRKNSRNGQNGYRGGRRGGNSEHSHGRGRGMTPRSNNSNTSSSSRLVCQICTKFGHVAAKCGHHFDHSYEIDDTHAAHFSHHGNGSYQVDKNWYSDTGATDHITSDLDRLTTRDRYHGKEQIHTANGTGMSILHVGNSQLIPPHRTLKLCNVLHAPHASKNLLSVHRFTHDNDAFFEFHPNFFVLKDRATKTPLLQGRCEAGLYPIPLKQCSRSSKQAFHASSPSLEQWHMRLGHPSSTIVNKILQTHRLASSHKESVSTICNACQMAKSHQLPFFDSSSTMLAPLEQVQYDVWGPAIPSARGFKYYVSFIDSFSRYTWVYLLKHISDVEQAFMQFRAQAERLLNKKIISFQCDWGGEFQRLNSMFKQQGITHRVSCPHTHQQNGMAEQKHRHIVVRNRPNGILINHQEDHYS